MFRSLVGKQMFPTWEHFSHPCWLTFPDFTRHFFSLLTEKVDDNSVVVLIDRHKRKNSHLSIILCKCFIHSRLPDWEILRIPPLSLPNLSCGLHFTMIQMVPIGGVNGGIRERWGRDENNLSMPGTPVFMRVLRDLLRDEGFYPKVMFSTSMDSWRKIWACSLNLSGFSVVR